MIGIIGALSEEVEGLKERMENRKTETIGSMEFSTGYLEHVECVVARCGVGKVHAAMCAMAMILRYHPSLVLNTGVAGGIGHGVSIGEIVVASDVVQHDMDTTAMGDPQGLLPGLELVHLPCSKPLIETILQAARGLEGPVCHVGTIATGDQFVNDKETLTHLRQEFGAIACEMEGGSIGQVCTSNQVPFAVIRAISDNADEESHMDYEEFLGPAAETSIRLLCGVLPALGKISSLEA